MWRKRERGLVFAFSLRFYTNTDSKETKKIWNPSRFAFYLLWVLKLEKRTTDVSYKKQKTKDDRQLNGESHWHERGLNYSQRIVICLALPQKLPPANTQIARVTDSPANPQCQTATKLFWHDMQCHASQFSKLWWGYTLEITSHSTFDCTGLDFS